MDNDYIKIKSRLAAARYIAQDFRGNTSLDTIICEYEARVKEMEKQRSCEK